ncbi:unnamed protein product [Rotaria sp. Silwood2]|nr:unnamed protein product [Rotaria sp. Silwood2]CAF4379107.1 unnamed protein product [Rotaria sp. Silwood2]
MFTYTISIIVYSYRVQYLFFYFYVCIISFGCIIITNFLFLFSIKNGFKPEDLRHDSNNKNKVNHGQLENNEVHRHEDKASQSDQHPDKDDQSGQVTHTDNQAACCKDITDKVDHHKEQDREVGEGENKDDQFDDGEGKMRPLAHDEPMDPQYRDEDNEDNYLREARHRAKRLDELLNIVINDRKIVIHLYHLYKKKKALLECRQRSGIKLLTAQCDEREEHYQCMKELKPKYDEAMLFLEQHQ